MIAEAFNTLIVTPIPRCITTTHGVFSFKGIKEIEDLPKTENLPSPTRRATRRWGKGTYMLSTYLSTGQVIGEGEGRGDVPDCHTKVSHNILTAHHAGKGRRGEGNWTYVPLRVERSSAGCYVVV